jgi:hypothetical protein
MPDADAVPYERLASLIEIELQLVGERQLAALAAVARERNELQGSLPDTPPDAARSALERCLKLHKRVEIEMLRVREALLSELGQVTQAQRAADGYAPVRRGSRLIVASA